MLFCFMLPKNIKECPDLRTFVLSDKQQIKNISLHERECKNKRLDGFKD